jgi:hypothetical protein
VQSHWALVSTFDDNTSQPLESRLALSLALRAWESRLGFEQATTTPGFARSFLPPPPNNGPQQTQQQAHLIPALPGTSVCTPRPPRVPGPGHTIPPSPRGHIPFCTWLHTLPCNTFTPAVTPAVTLHQHKVANAAYLDSGARQAWSRVVTYLLGDTTY